VESQGCQAGSLILHFADGRMLQQAKIVAFDDEQAGLSGRSVEMRQ
jgi:hypothetical protein